MSTISVISSWVRARFFFLTTLPSLHEKQQVAGGDSLYGQLEIRFCFLYFVGDAGDGEAVRNAELEQQQRNLDASSAK